MMTLIADLRLATRNLRRNARRSIVATMTLAFGILAYLLAGGFIEWIFEAMRETTIHSQLGHIQIVSPGYFEKGVADPYSFLLPERSPEQQIIQQMPGFQGIAPRLSFSGLLSSGDATVPFIGEGVDPIREKPISTNVFLMSGQDLLARDEKMVLLGQGLARSLGANDGDNVILMVTAANGSPNAVEARVAGTFMTSSKEYDDRALRLPIEAAKKLMRVPGETSWVVSLDRTERTAESTEYLSSRLPKSDFEVVPWTTLADFYNKTVVLFSKQVNFVKIIVGIIIVLTISNTQMMSILERTTEIGTSLALGLRRNRLLQMFVVEGALIGIWGGLFGIGLGYLLAAAVSAIGIPMPPAPGMSSGFTGQILVTPELAGDAMILALLTALLASLLPAWKASRTNIVDALRHNQ